MENPSLGEQELEVLRFIADRAPASAREVAEQFGEAKGLARTTVLTVMERLRKKGYLTRKRRQGVFHYSPRVPQSDVLQSLVRQFVEKTLAGSVSPIVAYLVKSRQLSEDELRELQRLVDELRGGPSRGPDDER
jgi:predicted transcriptional regulator